MAEFTKDDIEHYRKQYALWTSRRQTTPEEIHLIARLRDALDEIERLQQRIAELEEALTKIASYESMRFKLSPYEYGLLEQIVGIAEHALRDGE